MSDASDPIDLRDLLNKPLGDYPDRPNLPGAKTFFGKLVKVETDHSRQKKTPLFRFFARLTDPGKDVTQAEMKAVADAGFSLADYEVFAEYYVTPNAMPIFRRFVESLGFPPNVTFVESLKLDENCNPTQETQELIRGKDVICRTQAPDDQGRVFARLDSIQGTKRD